MKYVILLVLGFVSGALLAEDFGGKVKALFARELQVVRAWRVSLAGKIKGK